MSLLRRGWLLASAVVFVIGCAGVGAPTAAPSAVLPSAPVATTAPTSPVTAPPQTSEATAAPSVGPTSGPSASLDPTLSDAGIVARVTLANDSFGQRDGTYDVVGLAADASDCSPTFEGDEYIAVAWHDDAPIGQIFRFGVSVAADDVPDADGTVTGVTDGGVSFDFVSETGVGTQYSGNSTVPNSGSSTIDVTRSGSSLTFDFEAVTFAGATFSGQMICADG